jgi:hypothetical protein
VCVCGEGVCMGGLFRKSCDPQAFGGLLRDPSKSSEEVLRAPWAASLCEVFILGQDSPNSKIHNPG